MGFCFNCDVYRDRRILDLAVGVVDFYLRIWSVTLMVESLFVGNRVMAGQVIHPGSVSGCDVSQPHLREDAPGMDNRVRRQPQGCRATGRLGESHWKRGEGCGTSIFSSGTGCWTVSRDSRPPTLTGGVEPESVSADRCYSSNPTSLGLRLNLLRDQPPVKEKISKKILPHPGANPPFVAFPITPILSPLSYGHLAENVRRQLLTRILELVVPKNDRRGYPRNEDSQ